MPAIVYGNAFATRTEAATTAELRGAQGVAFLDLDDDVQDALLEWTALGIDALDYAGTPVSDGQAMSFPRRNARSDALRRLKAANIEEALAHAKDFAPDAAAAALNPEASGNGNVKREKTGPLEVEYFAPNTLTAGSLDVFQPLTRTLLWPLLASSVVEAGPTAWGQGTARRSS